MSTPTLSPAGALALAIATLGVGPGLARAQAPEPAKCTLRAVHATPTGAGFDPSLGELKAKLEKPPFNQWKAFRLLSSNERVIAPGATAGYPLPNGKEATLRYQEHTVSGARHVLHAEIELPGEKSVSKTKFALDEGGVFLVAAEAFQGGRLIYAIRCDAPHAGK